MLYLKIVILATIAYLLTKLKKSSKFKQMDDLLQYIIK